MIVERGIDVVAPVLHEFTYQAFLADVLGVESRYTTDEGQEIIVDESDSVWVRLQGIFTFAARLSTQAYCKGH